jgi:hypothetical protein
MRGMGHRTKFLFASLYPKITTSFQAVTVVEGVEISYATLLMHGIPQTNFQRDPAMVIKNSIYHILNTIKILYLVGKLEYTALSLNCRNVHYVWNLYTKSGLRRKLLGITHLYFLPVSTLMSQHCPLML